MTNPIQDAVEDVKPPIVVNTSVLGSQLASSGRIITIFLAGMATLIQLLSARDLMAVWLWLQTTEGVGFLTAATTALTFVYSLYKTTVNKKKLIVLAAAAPDSVGQVKGTSQ